MFIINRKSVRLTAGILDASRVGTVGGEVANLGNDALRADIDVLGVASALVGHQIRTDIERELRRAGASARELGVHVELFTLTAGLHRAFTVGIIPVVGHEAVVIGSRQAVLLVPAELAVELHALLCEMLLLRHDAVHVVVAHLQPVGSCLAVRSGIGSRSTCQTVECVIRIGMRHLSARLSAFGKCDLVGNAEHVAYGIVGIGIVHDGLAACVDRQVPKSKDNLYGKAFHHNGYSLCSVHP